MLADEQVEGEWQETWQAKRGGQLIAPLLQSPGELQPIRQVLPAQPSLQMAGQAPPGGVSAMPHTLVSSAASKPAPAEPPPSLAAS